MRKIVAESYSYFFFIFAVFESPLLQSVVFEWTGVNKNCTADDFKKVLSLLKQNGFKLYKWKRFRQKWGDASLMSDEDLVRRSGANLFWSKTPPQTPSQTKWGIFF